MDLDAIREREAAATSGPWEVRDHALLWNTLGLDQFKDRDPAELKSEHLVVTSWIHGQIQSEVVIFCVAVSPYFDRPQHIHIRPQDAAFIAAARQDIPDLLAALDLATARAAGIEAAITRALADCPFCKMGNCRADAHLWLAAALAPAAGDAPGSALAGRETVGE